MSILKEFAQMVEHGLTAVFDRAEHDPTKQRKAFVRQLDKALTMFNEGRAPRGETKFFVINNNVVFFMPNVDGRLIEIPGVKPAKSREGYTGYPFSTERFPGAVAKLKAAAEAGDLDEQIAPEEGTITRNVRQGMSSGDRPKRSSALKGTTWSPERRAAFDAKKAKAGK